MTGSIPASLASLPLLVGISVEANMLTGRHFVKLPVRPCLIRNRFGVYSMHKCGIHFWDALFVVFAGTIPSELFASSIMTEVVLVSNL